jgi:segregation and condensation protein A
MSEYRVNLDMYNGPLDLLLYLIRRDELDIYDIPIARITDQYVRHVEVIQALDPNLAGEFLVMAATLLEIKSRMLLPSPPPEEASPDGLGIDPRAELVKQLLEYKAFKDAAADLAAAAGEQAKTYARRVTPEGADPTEVDLDNVQVWHLFDAFSKLMEAIGHRITHHEVIYDDTPQELHQADILDRLQRDGPITFRRVFEGCTSRTELAGMFLALLELVRQKRVCVRQETAFDDIYIALRPASEQPAPQVDAPGTQTPIDEQTPAPDPDPDPQGQYVSEERPELSDGWEEDNGPDDDRPEAAGTGT